MKASTKDILREIKKSGMRFFYISAIIALGVAFFCGIKATSPSMIETAVEYFDSYALSDFRVLSTYGFRDQDIQTLAQVDGVEEAVGGYSMDVLMNIEDEKEVVKILSLPDPGGLNQPILVDGRFPETISECVVETTQAHLKNTAIGDTITVLDESQTEDTLSHLRSRDFTIVGYVQTPQYISLERGNTTISDGTIDGYMFVTKDTFDYERFTEAYIYTDVSAEGTHPYSDEYSEAQELMISRLETTGEEILDDNITDIRSDAQKEIDDAQKTLDDSRKDFEIQIASAYQEIQDGQAQLNEGYAQYQTGLREFNSQMAQAQAQLSDSQSQLDSGYAAYEVGRAQLASEILNGQNKLLEARNQIEQGYLSYNQGIAEFNNRINQAELELAQAQNQIEEGYVEYNKNKALYDAQKPILLQQFEESQKEIDQGLSEYQYQYSIFESKISQAQAELNKSWDVYNTELDKYNANYSEYTDSVKSLKSQIASLEEQIKEIESSQENIAEEKRLKRQYYEDLNAQFDLDRGQLETDMNTAQVKVQESESAVAEALIQLEPVRNEYQNLVAEKRNIEEEYTHNENSIQSQKYELSETNYRIAAIDQNLNEAEETETLLYEQGLLKTQSLKLEDSITQLNSSKAIIGDRLSAQQSRIDEVQNRMAPLEENYNLLINKKVESQGQLDQARTIFNQREREVADALSALEVSQRAQNDAEAKLKELKAQLSQAKAQLSYLEDVAGPQLEAAKSELDGSYQKLKASQTELDQQREAGETELLQVYSKLQQAQEQLDKGREELESQGAQLENVLKTLKQSEIDLENGKKLLEEQKVSGQQELNEALSTLKASELELIMGEADLEKGRVEGENQLNEAYQQLLAGQQALDAGRAELQAQRAAAQSQLDSALSTLEVSQEQLDAGIAEFETQKADGEQQLAEAQDEINSGIQEINDLDRGKWYVYSRDDNPGYSGYQEDAERIDNVGNVFPLFFFLVAALVAFTTMTRMVEEERTQIGTLYALGYSRAQIIKKYVVYSGTAALIGATLGWIVGVTVLPLLIFTAYSILYQMPDFVLEIPWNIVIISYFVALFCTVGAAVIIALMELRSVPAELMRPKAPKPGKRILLERMPFIWNRLSFITKVSLRNIFRYKARFFMTVIGIAGCTALILAGFGLHDAIFAIIPNQFGTIFKYDQTLIVKDNDTDIVQKVENVLKDERVSGALAADQKSITVSTDQGTLNAYLIIPKDTQDLEDYIGLHERLEPEKPLTLTDNGVIVSEKLATNYGASPGGSINLNIDNEKYTVPVTNQTENYLQNYIYMTPAEYESLTGKAPDYTVIFVNFKDDVTEEADQQQFAADMIDTGDYTSAINVAMTIENADKTMQSLNVLVIVMIVSAGMLAFIVLNNLTNINISERIREIATLKVLGFRSGETNNYIFRENIVLSLFGIVLGIILGVLLLKFIIFTVELDIIMFGREIKPLSYLYAIILTIGFTIIVNFSTIPTMKRVNMVEALKDID